MAILGLLKLFICFIINSKCRIYLFYEIWTWKCCASSIQVIVVTLVEHERPLLSQSRKCTEF